MNGKSIMIEREEVVKWLPHRPPFLLVDYATKYQQNRSLVGHKNVQEDDLWFEGHFPKMPIMPGVLLIESMAQTGALLAAKSMGINSSLKTILFSSVDKAKFKKSVIPPVLIDIPVEIVKIRRNFITFSGQVCVDGKLVASCNFMAIAVENLK